MALLSLSEVECQPQRDPGLHGGVEGTNFSLREGWEEEEELLYKHPGS